MESIKINFYRSWIRILLILIIIFSLADICGVRAQMLDQTKNRVQTTLEVNDEMELIGTLRPLKVNEIKSDQWMIGCETLDRDLDNYNVCKEYLIPLGIKRIRLQSGWASCERESGEYDFRWGDIITGHIYCIPGKWIEKRENETTFKISHFMMHLS